MIKISAKWVSPFSSKQPTFWKDVKEVRLCVMLLFIYLRFCFCLPGSSSSASCVPYTESDLSPDAPDIPPQRRDGKGEGKKNKTNMALFSLYTKLLYISCCAKVFGTTPVWERRKQREKVYRYVLISLIASLDDLNWNLWFLHPPGKRWGRGGRRQARKDATLIGLRAILKCKSLGGVSARPDMPYD